MTEEEWEEHLNFLDNAEISPYPITVGGSHTRGYGTVTPHLYVDQEDGETEREAISRAAREIGRLGGLAKSEAKAASSRENGKKGGRPRKVGEEAIETVEESNLDLFK